MNKPFFEHEPELNVLGGRLELCSMNPLTGFFRNGNCITGPLDEGRHTVCAVMTDGFLAFSKSRGNDLSTPMPQSPFPASRMVTAGASWRSAGSRPSRRAWRRRSC